jgi:hypothetical protein
MLKSVQGFGHIVSANLENPTKKSSLSSLEMSMVDIQDSVSEMNIESSKIPPASSLPNFLGESNPS